MASYQDQRLRGGQTPLTGGTAVALRPQVQIDAPPQDGQGAARDSLIPPVQIANLPPTLPTPCPLPRTFHRNRPLAPGGQLGLYHLNLGNIQRNRNLCANLPALLVSFVLPIISSLRQSCTTTIGCGRHGKYQRTFFFERLLRYDIRLGRNHPHLQRLHAQRVQKLTPLGGLALNPRHRRNPRRRFCHRGGRGLRKDRFERWPVGV